MFGLSGIFLCDLQLHHQWGFRHCPKKRIKRLSGLKINRSVFDLYKNIGCEFSVQRYEFQISAFGSVFINGHIINKGPPHNCAAIRLQSFGQHIGSVGMTSAVLLRAGLSFRIGLDQKSPKVRYLLVNLFSLVFPPLAHFCIQRVSRREPSDFLWGGKFDTEINMNAVRSQNICYSGGFLDVFVR